jgi:hypothetical protein
MKVIAIKLLGAAGAIICGAITVPAGAQTIMDEVRCVALSNALATGSDNARARLVGASVSAYFLGRLDARPRDQVKAAVAAQKRPIGPSEATAAMKACAARAARAQAQLYALTK